MSDQPDDDAPDVHDLIDELEELSETAESEAVRHGIDEAIEVARNVRYPSVFGRVIRGFDHRDAAEAPVGSVLFGIPMIIEGGTLEVGAFIATHPAYYAGTVLFGVAMVYGVIYVAEIQHVEIVNPLFGVFPRRLVGVLSISFAAALVLMTAWGRVDWSTPGTALAQVSVAFVGMSLGAALGDILPGS